jgi:2,5-dioxopentanoate dehydrogenase
MNHPYHDASGEQVNEALLLLSHAFKIYQKQSLKQRAGFLRTIAEKLGQNQEQLLSVANLETHLGEARLKTELTRTIFQLNSYAKACEEGTWLDIRIDTADPHRNPPTQDLRKMLVPLGPVAVFGASNFPFAYSTAGGDTACAFAAGCTVIVKGHPAHAGTSQMVAELIGQAAIDCDLPASVFIHLHGTGTEVGRALVEHPLTAAVGFTGSFEGGKALFDLANQRKLPIPVFAEMGSVNPVFLLPGKIKEDAEAIASMYAGSVTLSAGQFCTNPGLLVGIAGAEFERFKSLLAPKIQKAASQIMLHPGIAKSFHEKRKNALEQPGVSMVAEAPAGAEPTESLPTIATVNASLFLQNNKLHQEVFGPYSLLVECSSRKEMNEVAEKLEGQLTCTLIATDQELSESEALLDILKSRCGRLILNGVPTGVEVALSMHHGGPFPATTDSRFTSVGADGIRRFARPVCFQNWPNQFLPDELKDENPLRLWRTVNEHLVRES